MNQEKIGKIIREMRNEKKMTQQELAEKIGVTDRAISKWENGRGTPDISFLIPLAKELGITVLELLNGEKVEDQNNAVIELMEQNDRKIKIWKRLSFVLLNVILFVLIFILFFGFIIPQKYENSNTKGIARIQSASMEPTFKVGDGIIYDKTSINSVKKDDLVVYYYMDSDGAFLANVKVVHRVTDVIRDENGKINLITKGDNNTEIDKINVIEKNYLGVYNHKTSFITNIFLKQDSQISPIAFMIMLLGIIGILYMDILQLKKKYFNN